MGVIMHKNVSYGGGSVVEPNPQESATEQLETLGIDGDVYEVTDADAVHSADVGVANGIAELDSNGKVPASQLPSYVDDVIEAYYDSVSDRFYEESTFTTVIPPESGKTWVDIPANKSYRWTGSVYVRTDEGVQLGETSDTAYRGDRGKIAYDHSQSDHSGIKPAFTEASTRANIASGETIATIFGKIKKFFSDLKAVAFSGSYNDLSDKPAIPTKTSDLTNDSDFVESSDLATVATSGSYNDLTNKPTIPAAQVNSDWDASSGVAQILHKPALATVATSGSYNDLSNKPTIPTVNNGTLTIQKNGTNVQTFSANQSGNATANITVPTGDLASINKDGTSSTKYLRGDGTWQAFPSIPAAQVNSDWNATSGVAQILNKPTIPAAVAVKGNAESSYRTGNVNLTPANIGAVAKSGDTMTGALTIDPDMVQLNFRNNASYYTTATYQTAGNEALVFATKQAVTSFMFINGEDSVSNHNNNRWQSLTPALQIKNNKIAVGKLIANNTDLTYPLEINGDVLATNFRGGLKGNADTATSATTASKLGSSNVGSATKPIYLNAGTATACTYALNKDVPSDALFTDTDTKNTAGTTNTTSKIYLAGATSQAANPQTYSNANCYASGGKLYSNAKEVVTLSDSQALTNKTYNGYTLAGACAKAVQDSSSATSLTASSLPTGQTIAAYIKNNFLKALWEGTVNSAKTQNYTTSAGDNTRFLLVKYDVTNAGVLYQLMKVGEATCLNLFAKGNSSYPITVYQRDISVTKTSFTTGAGYYCRYNVYGSGEYLRILGVYALFYGA